MDSKYKVNPKEISDLIERCTIIVIYCICIYFSFEILSNNNIDNIGSIKDRFQIAILIVGYLIAIIKEVNKK